MAAVAKEEEMVENLPMMRPKAVDLHGEKRERYNLPISALQQFNHPIRSYVIDDRLLTLACR